MGAKSAIEIRGLNKTFRTGLRRAPVRAVSGLNLEVHQGSVVAFVGPNGAGKTTTIYLLLGLLRPDEGAITVLGRSPSHVANHRRIGYQSEIFRTYNFRSPTTTLQFYGKLSGMRGTQLRERVSEMIDYVGLSQAAHRRIGTFSKGMNQRLGLAQALLHKPDLLILDEPTTGLDPQGRKMVGDIIQQEKDRGATVFLSSHILSDVERFCDSVVMMNQGHVVLTENMNDLRSRGNEWIVEVLGWNDSLAGQIVGYTLSDESGESVFFSCTTENKNKLLSQLLNLPVEIGAIRRKALSLEELYMEMVETGSKRD